MGRSAFRRTYYYLTSQAIRLGIDTGRFSAATIVDHLAPGADAFIRAAMRDFRAAARDAFASLRRAIFS